MSTEGKRVIFAPNYNGDMHTPETQIELDLSLIQALIRANHSLVEIILERGGNPNAKAVSSNGVNGSPALELALYQPSDVRLKLVCALMAHGADPNDSEIFGIDSGRSSRVSPFMRACIRNDEMCAGAMMDSAGPTKVDLLTRDHHGWIPSMGAVESSPAFLDKLQSFFERVTMTSHPELKRDHLWTCLDNNGRNSAMLCFGRPASLQWLNSQIYLDFPGLINTKDTSIGETALWAAARQQNKAIVDFLLTHGADATLLNRKGESLVSYLEDLCLSDLQLNRHLPSQLVSIKNSVKATASAQLAMASIEEMLDKMPYKGQKVVP